jgi:hypothetical protein
MKPTKQKSGKKKREKKISLVEKLTLENQAFNKILDEVKKKPVK